jgi:hypothetical protein
MQDGRVVRVGVPDLDGHQILPLELDDTAVQLQGDHHSLRNLAR